MSKVHVKTGDTVVILSGKDRGKKGKIMAVSPKEGKVIVEDANIVSKHVKPRKMGEAGGIIKAEVRDLRLQGPGCLPPLRQADPCHPQSA